MRQLLIPGVLKAFESHSRAGGLLKSKITVVGCNGGNKFFVGGLPAERLVFIRVAFGDFRNPLG